MPRRVRDSPVRRVRFANVDRASASVYVEISYDPRHTLGRESKGMTCRFAGTHKTNTTPGSGKDQHANNTDKTVLPGTRRHAC